MGGLEGRGSIYLYMLSSQLSVYHIVGIQHILTGISGTIGLVLGFWSDHFYFKNICNRFDHTSGGKWKQERKQNKTLKADMGPKQTSVDMYVDRSQEYHWIIVILYKNKMHNDSWFRKKRLNHVSVLCFKQWNNETHILEWFLYITGKNFMKVFILEHSKLSTVCNIQPLQMMPSLKVKILST